jgi:hypothetical protein
MSAQLGVDAAEALARALSVKTWSEIRAHSAHVAIKLPLDGSNFGDGSHSTSAFWLAEGSDSRLECGSFEADCSIYSQF